MDKRTEVYVPVLEVDQPIGRFYVGVMKARDLFDVSYTDMRKIESDFDRYVGIQRSLNTTRVKEIAEFIKSIDATFPTSVVLAVRGDCAELIEEDGATKLRIFESADGDDGKKILLGATTSILDGQHRVEGLKESGRFNDFQVPVSIFVDADIADQAYIFATVNLAQTKVNKSLVYDLLDYAKARSPQKSAHDIAVALDRYEESPFYQIIKRLGAATPGRTGETLAQATVVNGILPLISKKPEQDRYELAKGRSVAVTDSSYEETPLRHLWVTDKDGDIAQILLQYFLAVKQTWPGAWGSREKGDILVRTNGFRAFIRLFKNIYLKEKPTLNAGHPIVTIDQFSTYLRKSRLTDADFNSHTFAPGTSGETALYKRLRDELQV